MKKLGCLIIVIGFIGIGGLLIAGIKHKAQEQAQTLTVNTPEKVATEKETKSQTPDVQHKKESTGYKSGYKAGYIVGKTAASEGRPMREYEDLHRHGYLLGNKNEDFARGFFYGWRNGFRERTEFMKKTGEKPRPYRPDY